MDNSLQEEYEYYLANKSELDEKYPNKFLAIKGHQVIGVFDSDLEAVKRTSETHEMGTFLIQRCGPDIAQYQTFHSRVAFG